MSAPVPTGSIIVGERIRKDLGDLEALARSVEKVQLQPIVVTPDRHLIAGERRLRACELAGIPVHIRIVATVKDALDALRLEGAENLERLPWSTEEGIRYGLRLRELEAPGAAQRQAEGRAKGGRVRAGTEEASGQDCPEAQSGERGRVNADVARALGMGRRSFEKGAQILAEVDANPDLAPLLVELNKTGRVDAVYRKLERAAAAGGRIHDPDSYSTQQWILAGIHAVEPDGIALDPCTNELARRLGFVHACESWTIDDDARAQPTWRVCELHHHAVGGRRRDKQLHGRYVVFFQPPYSCPDDGDKKRGLPGLTTKLCEEWDAGRIDRAYALVKDDASTDWWAKLRDRAAILVKPRKRLAHVVGVDGEGNAIEHDGSDFNSAMWVLARGTRTELVDICRQLAKAYEGRADVYPALWILESAHPQPPSISTGDTETEDQ